MWNTIFFDLDGTLTDSAEGIAESVQYALHTQGIEEPDLQKLRAFVGPPLHQYFMEYAGFSVEQAEEAVEAYRRHYNTQGMYRNRTYPDIAELLYALKRNGKTLAVVTSKETQQAVKVLKEFGLIRYFDAVIGCTPENTNASKESLVEEAISALGKQYDRGNCVMVGDRFYDVDGAKATGISSVGVAYGYGTKEELADAGADYIVDSIGALGRLLLDTGRAPWTNGAATTGRKVWNIVWPILLWLLISNIVGGIIGGVYGVFYSLTNPVDPGDMTTFVEEMTNQLYSVSNVASGIANIITIPIVWQIMKRDERGRSGINFTLKTVKKPGIQNGLLAVLMGFATSTVLNATISFTGIAEWMYEMNPERYDQMDTMPVWASFILLCLLAPITEELLFRGVVFRRMRDYTGFWIAAAVSAAIFGIVHFDIVTGICAGLIGIVMAMIYERTGSIFTPMLFHFGFNFYSVLIDLLGVEHMQERTGTYVMVGMLSACLIIGIITYLIFFMKNKKSNLDE